ncbi:ATP-dependent 3'-5' DNA helicase [Malassezia sp. CBS 17886]|nr:ATP-dependent 3'-5' DNA helicase [Malassezia sp. CBS 17886]
MDATPPRGGGVACGEGARGGAGGCGADGAHAAAAALDRAGSPDTRPPYPDAIAQLLHCFKALNTVYTFCSAHKQLVPTFTNLRAGMRPLVPAPLTVDDIAKMKAVCPVLLDLAYVPATSVDADADDVEGAPPRKRGRGRGDVYGDARRRWWRVAEEASANADASAGAAAPPSPLFPPATSPSPSPAPPPFTLILEFTDRSVNTGKATARRTIAQRVATRTKDVAKQTAEIIAQRTATFEHALNELMAACHASGDDPVALIEGAARAHIPTCPGEEPRPQQVAQRKCLAAALENADARASIRTCLDELPAQPWWRDQIVPGGRRTMPARPPTYADVQMPDATARALLEAHGVRQLYAHQAAALQAFERGQHVVVCTGTSSGKSLVYQVPMLSALAQDAHATVLCMFPTKALAQDQRQSLQRLLDCGGAGTDALVATYDGDTEMEQRAELRRSARVLFTNPDMLHQSILPREEHWRRFFRGLRIVVVDELHVYAGIFGSHVAMVLRRLRRLCAALGNDRVQFVSCSATIANPAAHMHALTGVATESTHVVTQDGAPCGQKEWALWNPPLVNAAEQTLGRVSAYAEVSQLFRHLILQGIRTIVFAKVRRTCEIIVRQVREDLARDGHADLVDRVFAYRSGYAPRDRRRMEQDLFHGRALGVVATSALELGVDIGSLDAVILFGIPYSFASMWQQAGRAGRRQKDALVVLLAEPFVVDQYYMRQPQLVFAQADPPLCIDTENELLLAPHLACAALEVPVHPADDARFFGPRTAALCARHLERDPAGYYHYTGADPAPARDVALRGARQLTYRYVDVTAGTQRARLLEEVEEERAFFEAFQGAVFLHQGNTYICEDVLPDLRIARMVRADVLYHTRPRDYTDTDARETWRIRTLQHAADTRAYFGRVTITHHVWGYFKVDRRAHILDTVEVDGAPMVRDTRGIWIDVPWPIVEAVAAQGINAPAAIHAAEHALLSLTPLFVASTAADVRTECKVSMREVGAEMRPTRRKRPSRLIFYDMPGQDAGMCAQVFQHLDTLLQIALSVIEACSCVDGCPGCVETASCSGGKEITSKVGAQAVLRGLLRRPMFDENEPLHNAKGHASRILSQHDSLTHTLCAADPVAPPQQWDSTRFSELPE